MIFAFLLFGLFGLMALYSAYGEFRFKREQPPNAKPEEHNNNNLFALMVASLFFLGLSGLSLMVYFEEQDLAATGHSERQEQFLNVADLDPTSEDFKEQLLRYAEQQLERETIQKAVGAFRSDPERRILVELAGSTIVKNLTEYPNEVTLLLEAIMGADDADGEKTDLSDILVYEEEDNDRKKVKARCLDQLRERLGEERVMTAVDAARSTDVVARVNYVLTNNTDEIGLPAILSLQREVTNSRYPAENEQNEYDKLLGLQLEYTLRLSVDGVDKEEKGVLVPHYERHRWSKISDPYALITQLTAEQLADRIITLAVEE